MDFASSALAGLLPPRVVHQDLAHQARSDSEKCDRFSNWVPLINESHVGLVHERGWLQRVAESFSSASSWRKLTKFLVDKRYELVEGLLVPFAHSASNSVTSWVSDIARLLRVLNFSRAGIIHDLPRHLASRPPPPPDKKNTP